MPIIKSAIKRVKQDQKKTQRNRQVLSRMRSLMKNILLWTKSGEIKKAENMYADTQKAIDTAAKKNLIHKNNAARKKSLLARSMKAAGASTAAPTIKAEKKAAPKKKTTAKK